MKITRCILLALTALFFFPFGLQAARKKGSPAPDPNANAAEPSMRLRHLIDATLPKITDISKPKQKPTDRTALIEAQADFTVKAQTAPPAQQPMYQAALNVITNLLGAVNEHEKAVAEFQYSNSVHGKQDREDAKVAIWQRGPGQGRAAEADNAKQKMENADSRKALLDKEKFMSEGAISAWTQRVGQIHATVEQTFTTELVAEKQLAMLASATPPPVPVPRATPNPAETSAGDMYSPVGSWKADKGLPLFLKEDGTAMRGAKGQATGTWKWTDQSKGALSVSWTEGRAAGKNDGVTMSADGQKLTGSDPANPSMNFTRQK